jgi:hypothetical protein
VDVCAEQQLVDLFGGVVHPAIAYLVANLAWAASVAGIGYEHLQGLSGERAVLPRFTGLGEELQLGQRGWISDPVSFAIGITVPLPSLVADCQDKSHFRTVGSRGRRVSETRSTWRDILVSSGSG